MSFFFVLVFVTVYSLQTHDGIISIVLSCNREERANTECNVILEQLGLTGADVMTEETECWEKKASNTASQSKDKESIPTESVFNMLGLSETDIQTTGEAWESKTGL